MWGTKWNLDIGDNVMQWLEEGTREREVAGSNPAGLIAANFTRKMPEMGGHWPVGASTD